MNGRKATLSGSYQFSSPTISARAWKREPIGRQLVNRVSCLRVYAGRWSNSRAIVATSARARKPVEPCGRESDRAMRSARGKRCVRHKTGTRSAGVRRPSPPDDKSKHTSKSNERLWYSSPITSLWYSSLRKNFPGNYSH